MANAVNKDIGNPPRRFIFTKLPASKGTPILWLILPVIPTFIKLRSMAFNGMAKVVAGAAAKDPGAKPTQQDLEAAVGEVFADGGIEKLILEMRKALTPAEFMDVTRGLFESVSIALGTSVQQLDMDVHFDGVSMDQMTVLGEALKVNFGGFLAGAGSTSNDATTAPT
jgi:hypothetical protein